MKILKIAACVVVIFNIAVVMSAPPRNVVQMQEEKRTKDVHADVPMVNEAEKLTVDELQPPDHLDAVKLEKDGMINKDFKKEIFLGEHEEIEDDDSDIAESKLKDIFTKVDEDADNRLCIPELESWIKKKTEEHFDEGLEENEHIFKHLDPDGDGLVDWKEYYIHFLLAKGYPADQAKKHVEDYDIDLDYQEREQLIRYKFKWTEADINPVDNKLSKEEFLAFRHPEQSTQALANMVKTIMESLDKNEDHVLTEDEFVTLPLGDIDDEEQKKLDNSWKKQRSVEFRNQIDADHDGKATDKELLMYIDPRSEENAHVDAKSLVDNLDDDNDSCISWSEIEDNKDIFIESKVVNVRRILHDEF